MISNLKRAMLETGHHCRIHMDLGGPRLRTGILEPGPAVLKYRPKRDAYGRVIFPARIFRAVSTDILHFRARVLAVDGQRLFMGSL